MKFLQRFTSTRSNDPVDDFWGWWNTKGERAFTNAVTIGSFDELMDPMTQRVKATHPELVWEARQGTNAQHMLCVTPGGISAAREASQRWYRAAPRNGYVWEFAPITPQPTNPLNLTLFLGGEEEITMNQLRFAVRVGTKLDVTVCHGSFDRTHPDAQTEAAFSVLDALLGEDSVMRWIGAIETAGDVAPDAVEPSQLQSIVAAFAQRQFESWQVQQRELPDGQLTVLRLRAAEWLDRPELELHCALTLPYKSQDRTGVPSASEVQRLDAIEDRLEDGSELSRVLVGIDTGQHRRVLHYYADPSHLGSRTPLETFLRDNPEASLQCEPDPFWGALRKLRQQ